MTTAVIIVLCALNVSMFLLFNRYVHYTRWVCDLMIWALLDEHVYRARRDDLIALIKNSPAENSAKLWIKAQEMLIETAARRGRSKSQPPYTAEAQLWKAREESNF
jgi:hypothetical protein